MSVGVYGQLVAWQQAMALAEALYRVTSRLPVTERFGLVQQLRRGSISVASNIAEGHARRSKREYLRFVDMSMGSLAEIETQLELAGRLHLIGDDELAECSRLVESTGRLLRGLEKSLEAAVRKARSD